MEFSIFPTFSLVFSGIVIGSFVSETSPRDLIQNATSSFVDAAWINAVSLECDAGWIYYNQRRITLIQGSATHRQILSTLMAKAFAFNVAINAASISEIRGLYVSSDSRPLVTLLNLGNVINELKNFLLDICCLSRSFSSSFRSMNGLCMASVAVFSLANYARLSLNSAWM